MISVLKKLLVVLCLSLYISSFSLVFGAEKLGMAELQFECIFPASVYKEVYVTCVDMWQDLRSVEEKKLTEAQWGAFHEKLIDDLVALKVTIDRMLENPQSCSPDDLEYLMEILYLIHCEYVHMSNYKVNEMTVCIAVLFDHMQKLLSKPL